MPPLPPFHPLSPRSDRLVRFWKAVMSRHPLFHTPLGLCSSIVGGAIAVAMTVLELVWVLVLGQVQVQPGQPAMPMPNPLAYATPWAALASLILGGLPYLVGEVKDRRADRARREEAERQAQARREEAERQERREKAEREIRQADLQLQIDRQTAEATQAKREASEAKGEAKRLAGQVAALEALASKNTTNIAAVKATAEVAHEKVTDLGMFPSTRTEGEASSRPLSLLIVEDDPAPMYKLAKWFQLRGFTVTTAASVGEAIEAISAPGRDPHWAIIDLKMAGGGSGLDILKKIKEENKPTSVIVSTGVSDDEVLEEVKNMGAHKVFVKPTEPDVLWQTIMDEQARKLASQP
jgi:ActR/RegA family two-component response regulator